MGILLCLLILLALQWITPFWWWVMVVPFGYALGWARSGGDGFLTGAASAGLLWLGAALLLALTSADLVAARVATMLNLGGAAWVLALATGLVAALAAGLAGSTGFYLRAALQTRKTPGSRASRN
ncbi:hypothetical protein AWN76_017165 [Rhodothermaceae bacterium RA]|nr:hypothetical protein AWN76_017165 [Rhodothermaceae bacterium RA]